MELQLHTSAQGLPDDIRSTAADTELLRLDRHLQLTVFPATANQETESAVTQSMLSPADFSIRRNARLRWNEPLHTWNLRRHRTKAGLRCSSALSEERLPVTSPSA